MGCVNQQFQLSFGSLRDPHVGRRLQTAHTDQAPSFSSWVKDIHSVCRLGYLPTQPDTKMEMSVRLKDAHEQPTHRNVQLEKPDAGLIFSRTFDEWAPRNPQKTYKSLNLPPPHQKSQKKYNNSGPVAHT